MAFSQQITQPGLFSPAIALLFLPHICSPPSLLLLSGTRNVPKTHYGALRSGKALGSQVGQGSEQT